MKKKRSMKYGVLLTASLGLLLIFTAFLTADSQVNAYELTIEHFNEILSTPDFDNAAEAAVYHRARIAYAKALLADTYVSEDGTDVPRGSWWARQEAHDAFGEAIEAAKTALRLGGTFNFDVAIGTEYAIPFALERAPLPASFTIAFDPEKFMFAGVTEGEDIVFLTTHDPAEGRISFAFLNDSPELQNTDLVVNTHFRALESGATAVVVVGDWNEFDESEIAANAEAEMPIPSAGSETVYLEPVVIRLPDGNFAANNANESRLNGETLSPSETITFSELGELARSMQSEPIRQEPLETIEIDLNFVPSRTGELRASD